MRIIRLLAFASLFVFIGSRLQAGPIPIGLADVTFSYMTDEGLRVLSEQRDFSGTDHEDAVPLGGDMNLGYFNAVNFFGTRPAVPGLIGPDETLLAHAFFKDHENEHADQFFAGIVDGASLTLEVENIKFDQPVYIQQDTALFHRQWDADQVDQLENFYINLHNYNTLKDPFRDFDAFFPSIFTDFPEPNYSLATLDGSGPDEGTLEFFGDGTDTVGFKLTVPYSMFRHFEDVDQTVPEGLPAPFGFLEPFHFHFEWLISSVPEPTAALLLAAGGMILVRRRRA